MFNMTGYGVYTDDVTTFINASSAAAGYKITNHPIVFDVDIPEGCSKDMAPTFPVLPHHETKEVLSSEKTKNISQSRAFKVFQKHLKKNS